MLIDMARRVLTDNGFSVVREQAVSTMLIFEDVNVCGVVIEFGSCNELLQSWDRQLSTFLAKHANMIRAGGEKGWNIYSVFVTTAKPTGDESRQISNIEEDFSSTRKIAKYGVQTVDDMRAALLPLIPLQYVNSLPTTNTDELLRNRSDLSDIEKRALSTDRDSQVFLKTLSDEK